MSSWQHEQGYKEPEECGFCEKFHKMQKVDQHAIGKQGACTRNATPAELSGYGRTAYLRTRACSSRGTCRYFTRRTQ